MYSRDVRRCDVATTRICRHAHMPPTSERGAALEPERARSSRDIE